LLLYADEQFLGCCSTTLSVCALLSPLLPTLPQLPLLLLLLLLPLLPCTQPLVWLLNVLVWRHGHSVTHLLLLPLPLLLLLLLLLLPHTQPHMQCLCWSAM
jgi:hypothetical protein